MTHTLLFVVCILHTSSYTKSAYIRFMTLLVLYNNFSRAALRMKIETSIVLLYFFIDVIGGNKVHTASHVFMNVSNKDKHI